MFLQLYKLERKAGCSKGNLVTSLDTKSRELEKRLIKLTASF